MSAVGLPDKRSGGPVSKGARLHPREVLLGSQGAAVFLPVCDHFCGVESRMRKSLALQAEMSEEFGACVFDVTLDCEDGASAGGELDHANMVVSLTNQALKAIKNIAPRIAVRLHPVAHPAFEQEVEIVVGGVAAALCHLMIPKLESVAEIGQVTRLVDQIALRSGRTTPIPIHVLIESPAAVHRVFEIAAHSRVQSISFGLMDFVSAHGGAIPVSAMTVQTGRDCNELDQFSHPLVLRAKLEIASACHAHGKVPSHCVVTEFGDRAAVRLAATRASRTLGYARMWSIHPDQIRPILEAFAPTVSEIEVASNIIRRAENAAWSPIAVDGKLHDRASYRYFWQVLERAYRTGQELPEHAMAFFN